MWVLDSGRVTSWRADGRPEWMYGIRQDINRSKEAERRLAASEAFLERAGRLAGVGGWQLDLESGELTWTQQTARLLEVPPGYRPALERSLEFFVPEARPRLVAGIEDLRGTRYADVLELSAAYQAIAHETADNIEAIDAFIEKRTPKFTGA